MEIYNNQSKTHFFKDVTDFVAEGHIFS